MGVTYQAGRRGQVTGGITRDDHAFLRTDAGGVARDVFQAFWRDHLLIAKVSDIFAEIAASQDGQQTVGQESVVPTRPLVLGLVALMLSISAIASLLLSRWWQAMLYNPGGFGEEFHNLRLDIRVAGLSLLAFTLLLYLPGDFRFWAELMALPLLISGLSLVHFGVKALSQGRQWLVFMYVGLVVSGPVIGGLLVGLGIADSILNLRLRLTANKNRDQ